ncbi:MAG: hypothetical protein JXA69_21185 [Phycisphaerae bacterium]|nr:hypothetical protein [Phycisphaerae bacterium]
MTPSRRILGKWSAVRGNGWRGFCSAACLLVLLAACEPQTGQPVPPDAVTVGDSVWVDTATVDAGGGTIVVSEPGGALDGLVIDVPAGAYAESTTWEVAYRPILANSFGDAVEPLSPLISLDGPDDYADELVQVTVPVTVPDGYFAMGFYCDPSTGQLEAIPLVDQTANSVTLATRHFSEVLIGGIPLSQLSSQSVDTGFLPGRDDWHIPNWGSLITPLGNCSGTCITAMWYFIERRKQGEAPLWKRYDNGMGPGWQTPDFWVDDDSAIKLISVAQAEVKVLLDTEVYNKVLAAGLKDAERNFYAIAYAMKVTGEPQYIAIAKEGLPIGHALVCYGINGRTLHVADPNAPGDSTRTITFDGTKFVPYASGARKDDSQAYDKVLFYGKTSLVQWSRLASLWTDAEAGDIGRTKFPDFDLRVIERDDNDNIVEKYGLDMLNDNHVDKKLFEVQLQDRSDCILRIYRFENLSTFETSPIELKPGINRLGFYVAGNPELLGMYLGGTAEDWYLCWGAFDWVNVIYDEATPEPVDDDLSALTKCAISVNVHGHFRQPPIYEWQGSELQSYDSDISQTWTGTGSFSGNTFSASWSRAAGTISGEPYDSTGSLTVTLDPITRDVMSFTANKTETSPAGTEPVTVTTASIGGRGLPLRYYLNAPQYAPYLECDATGNTVCQTIDSFQYRVEQSESEWVTVVPWTEMWDFTCDDADWDPVVVISFTTE